MGKVTLPSPRHTHLLLGVLALRLEGGRDDDLCEAELCLFGLCWAPFSGERLVLTEGSVCRGFTNSASEKHTHKIRQTWSLPSALSQLPLPKALHQEHALLKHFFYLGCNNDPQMCRIMMIKMLGREFIMNAPRFPVATDIQGECSQRVYF